MAALLQKLPEDKEDSQLIRTTNQDKTPSLTAFGARAIVMLLATATGLGCATAAPEMTPEPVAGTDNEAAATGAALGAPAAPSQWANWRGPWRNGMASDTGLVSDWSVDGDNLIWRADFTGRSTPVVLGDRVCANGRAGEDRIRQEMVACFDAENGAKLWEKRFNIYNTSVPWTRVGWAHLAADPETGYLYVQGVGGLFFCLDSKDGREIWSRNLMEEYGFMEGYGGRTQTPLVDGDRLIVTFSNTSWGSEGRPLHRFRAFDKHTGELLWSSQPAASQADKNTQSTPNVLVVGGRRLIVAGNGGGGIHAVEASTGEPAWSFQLSKRGINTSVVVDGSTVYVSHSEENVDEGTMGRVVAIDASGTGDVTLTHELWRAPIGAGFSSPALADGVLYVVDNSANLHALDATTGEEKWELNLGRVGKGSPVVADGKLFVTEVNGRFLIVAPHPAEGEVLDLEEIRTADGRLAEIYGSAAIASGRIYFTTEEGIYCLGDKERAFESIPPVATWPEEETAPSGAEAARFRIVPAELVLRAGETADLRVLAFDSRGRPLGEVDAALTTWSLEGLDGSIDGNGLFRAAAVAPSHTGMVVARVGDGVAKARLRVLADLPLVEDFEAIEPGSRPAYQLGYLARFAVAEIEGNRLLAKGPSPIKIHRHLTFLGHPAESDYTIAADVRGTDTERKLPEIGVINSGYTLLLIGAKQRLQIRSWQSGLRMMEQIDFAWSPDTWYRMKLEARTADDVAVISGKVWPRDEEEPGEWNLVVEDPLPIRFGSPGLIGYSPTPVYFDNIEVTKNP